MERGDYWDGFDHGVDAAIVRRPHGQAIEDLAQQIQAWFPQANIFLENQHRAHGRPGQQRWPDIQFVHPTRRRATHVEVDTTRGGMNRHIADHLQRNPNRRGVFLRIDPRSGAILERAVYAAGSGRRPPVQRGSRAAPLVLRQQDVFDAFDD